MTLQEFWWLFDGKVAVQKQNKKSTATGGFSAAEWEKARKVHKDKMNA